MSGSTTELNLRTAQGSDDNASYLKLDLANSLLILDALFNNVSGHNHSSAHQGGPISVTTGQISDGAVTTPKIADGSVTSPKLADGAVVTLKLGDGQVTSAKIAAGAVGSSQLAQPLTLTNPTLSGGTLNNVTLNSATDNSPTITNPTINGTIAGAATFTQGPKSTDWFRPQTANQGIFNDAVGQGIAFDGSGPYQYPSGDRIVLASAGQTLSNKTLSGGAVNSATLTSCSVNSCTLNNVTDNSPTINNPTLAGTVSGTPGWASPQTFQSGSTLNGNAFLGNGALGVNATTGFPFISLMAGAPTGSAGAGGGARAGIVWDSGNRRLWVYDSSWHYAQFS